MSLLNKPTESTAGTSVSSEGGNDPKKIDPLKKLKKLTPPTLTFGDVILECDSFLKTKGGGTKHPFVTVRVDEDNLLDVIKVLGRANVAHAVNQVVRRKLVTSCAENLANGYNGGLAMLGIELLKGDDPNQHFDIEQFTKDFEEMQFKPISITDLESQLESVVERMTNMDWSKIVEYSEQGKPEEAKKMQLEILELVREQDDIKAKIVERKKRSTDD